MPQEKILVDGTSDWSGGFNTALSPFFIERNQYSLSVNTQIPVSGGGIENRSGFRCLSMMFNTKREEELYQMGNYQGEGWYFDGVEIKLLASVGGWIFEFSFINRFVLQGRIINLLFQNNPNNLYCWITPASDCAIINDGESLPIYTTRNETRRTRPKKGEIGVGLMGVYVQNRFFYVKPNRKEIVASTISNPIDLTEAYINNIYGFILPEDNDFITAIGKQKTIMRDAKGGNLAFASFKNNYSVDVRGDRNGWGTLAGRGVGFVDNTVTDVGACSSFSYEAFNGNIYFRNPSYGLSSTKLAQYQFVNNDTYYNHSIEASLFFNQDNECLLSKCYTRGYKSKIYTTIAPQLKDGFIYHNGLIVYAPDIYYTSNAKAQRRYESIYTGLRPWAVTVIDDHKDKSQMYVHSYDYDGKNRIYLLDENLDYDIDKDGERVEIESKIMTRAYGYGDDSYLKSTKNAFYSLKDIPRTVNIKIATRVDEHGKFVQFWNRDHKVCACSIKTDSKKEPCFRPMPVHSESRGLIMVAGDPVNPRSGNYGIGGVNYFTRQDLFTFVGPYTLRRWERIGTHEDLNRTIMKDEGEGQLNSYEELRLYTHQISK